MAREDSGTERSPWIGDDGIRERRPFPLVTIFGSVSLVIVVVIGLALGLFLRDTIRSRAFADAARSGEVSANLGVRPFMEASDLGLNVTPLPPERVQALDSALGSSLSTNGIVRINVWNSQQGLVYSDDPALAGRRFAPTEILERALAGEITTELNAPEERAEGESGELLAVYVPIRIGGDGAFTSVENGGVVIGAFEVYLPYAPIAANIRQDTQRLLVALGLGLAFLYLALFRIVVDAANRIRRQADQNLFLANHDKLTGLLNRDAFVRYAAHKISQKATPAEPEPGECTLLLVLSLDRFEVINETLGHSLGDQLLAVFADRLTRTIRSGDLAARIGGAEFGAVLTDVNVEDMDLPLTALLERLHAPVQLENLVVDIRASLGVVVLDGNTPMETALQHANIALSTAKADHTIVEFFRKELLGDSADTLKMAEQVRDGIENGEFVLHYQPKYSLATGVVNGSEALVRWNHPQRGFVLPGLFIAAVENLPVGRDLANHIIDMAIRDAALWQVSAPVGVAVNLSARDVNDPALSGYVAERLRAYKLPAKLLTLELTEGSVLLNEGRAIQTLQELRDLGCGIAIDDFGTGYASLSYLVRLPATEMKIDQSFVQDLDTNEQSAQIVRHCIDIAQTMGLATVGEGIETQAIQDRLAALGCGSGQGYLYSRPQPFGSFVEFMHAHVSSAAAPQ